MDSIAWWPSFAVLLLASGTDLYKRRIPNWLVVPFLVSGLVVRSAMGGVAGASHSLEGIALASLLFGPFCLLGGMGMGDLKLFAGVGAWIGPGQLFMAFVLTGFVGGVLALGYAIWRRSLGRCLDNTGDLFAHLAKFRRPERLRLDDAAAVSIPYAPAIAIGTLFSFFSQ